MEIYLRWGIRRNNFFTFRHDTILLLRQPEKGVAEAWLSRLPLPSVVSGVLLKNLRELFENQRKIFSALNARSHLMATLHHEYK
jgi:hypothetical protein